MTDDRAVRLALDVAHLTAECDELRAAYADLEAARLETMDQRDELRATLARVQSALLAELAYAPPGTPAFGPTQRIREALDGAR